MHVIKIIAWAIITIYVLVIVLLYTLQTKLIFYPGRLNADHKFKLIHGSEEILLRTSDGERISALFYANSSPDVILYFHGNSGDLSGWQYVAEDFTSLGYNFFIIDYRGYGKSSGEISESGFYNDAGAAYDFLIQRGFDPQQILIYGRSIGSGVAIDLAAHRRCKGLVLESPFSSLSKLANEKLPFLFPSVFLRYRFDNIRKMESVTCPVIFLHGSDDTLIPPAHSDRLYRAFTGRKKIIIVDKGAHNDLHTFQRYEEFLRKEMPNFFNAE